MLDIIRLVLGPVSTNCYLVADTATREAAVVDPAWDGKVILEEVAKRGWSIGQLWYTHAHFDHFAGAAELARALEIPPSVALHSLDRLLWEAGGLGDSFGYTSSSFPEPTIDLAVTHSLAVGAYQFQARHAPGHSPGSCIFFCAVEKIIFSGDLIFAEGVGRTDLPGGDWDVLLTSIREQVYTLPNETRILPGHGAETQVGEEKRSNPFIRA
jgi:hydroxyacylglutathione hydrolase